MAVTFCCYKFINIIGLSYIKIVVDKDQLFGQMRIIWAIITNFDNFGQSGITCYWGAMLSCMKY